MEALKIYLLGIQFKIIKTGDSCTHFKRYDQYNIMIILHNELNFYHISCDTIDKSIIKEKESELLNDLTNIQDIITKLIEFIETYDAEENDDENSDSDEKDDGNIKSELYLPKIDHKKDRKLTIYVWGREVRKTLPHKIDHNFNAAVIHGKKKGVDWRQNGRDSEEVRHAVMKGKMFTEFMAAMIATIEKHDCHTIGICCRKGRHRSTSCAIALQTYYYKDTIIHFLELKK